MAKLTEALIKKRDTPGVIAPPPIIFAGALGAAFLLDLLIPMKVPMISLEIPGYVLLGVGVLMVLWAFMAMRRAGTTANPNKKTLALVTGGPFRFSRNPVYLGMTMLYFGLALALNSLWPVVLYPLLLIVMLFGVIFREERYLLLRFGTKYLKYKVAVRRWL